MLPVETLQGEEIIMELELKTTHLNCYDTVLDTTLFHEETLESIVPDACPDILRIVDTEAVVCLNSKEVLEGRLEVDGTARCAILYIPDGADGVRRMTVSIPFACTTESAGLGHGCCLVAIPYVQATDARSLNPRKVLTRVNLAVYVQAFTPQNASFCDGVECDLSAGIQQLGEKQITSLVTAVEEKPFTFSDDLNLSGSRLAAELLKTRVDLRCNESKIIGNKLIFKGEADLQLLYRDPNGSVCPANFELPFSQIMEVSGVEEDADCALQVLLTGCECTLDGEEGRTVTVSLAMLAQAVVREERQVTLLSDIYSTVYDLTAERKPYIFYRLLEHTERRVTVREILETVTPAREVCDIYVNIGAVSASRDGIQVSLSAETTVTVLYRAEDDSLCTVTRSIPASCPIELPEGATCTCRCACPGERFATQAGGGVEVRYPLDFHYLALMPHHTTGVSDVRLDESALRDTAGQPSIVLRMVGEGEQLWDIAKAYGTTTEDIVQANALAEETLPMGQLLLIPKKR